LYIQAGIWERDVTVVTILKKYSKEIFVASIKGDKKEVSLLYYIADYVFEIIGSAVELAQWSW
jgi:hypothetical protein